MISTGIQHAACGSDRNMARRTAAARIRSERWHTFCRSPEVPGFCPANGVVETRLIASAPACPSPRVHDRK